MIYCIWVRLVITIISDELEEILPTRKSPVLDGYIDEFQELTNTYEVTLTYSWQKLSTIYIGVNLPVSYILLEKTTNLHLQK